jgi:cytochrome c biogenesis protein CcmG, thiol:disulfide interchange protein DsbE
MSNRLSKIILCLFTFTFYAFSQDTTFLYKSTEDVAKAIQLAIDESIGKQAPPLFLQDIADSNSHELSDYKGKVVLLNFWTRGCVQCVAELPDIGYLQDEYEKTGLKVIFASREDYDAQHRYFKIHEVSGMKTKIYGNYPYLYDLGFPKFILVDRNGIIKEAWFGAIGYDAMEKRINSLVPKETKSFKLRNPRLVLFSSVVFFGLCLILVGVIWNIKRKKAA